MRGSISVRVLVTAVILLAAAAAAGAVIGVEWLWGTGGGACAAALIVLAAFLRRERNLNRISAETPLAAWEYSQCETEQIARELLGRSAGQRKRVVILLTICLAMISAVFALVLLQTEPGLPPALLTLLAIPLVLPLAVSALHAKWKRALILHQPCVTVIGRDHLVLANTIPVINEREKLQARGASYVDMENGFARLKIIYTSISRTKTTVIHHRDTVDIPVPADARESARRLAQLLNESC